MGCASTSQTPNHTSDSSPNRGFDVQSCGDHDYAVRSHDFGSSHRGYRSCHSWLGALVDGEHGHVPSLPSYGALPGSRLHGLLVSAVRVCSQALQTVRYHLGWWAIDFGGLLAVEYVPFPKLHRLAFGLGSANLSLVCGMAPRDCSDCWSRWWTVVFGSPRVEALS
jgi:hypothetical protein